MNCDIVFHLNVLLYFLQCIEYDFPSNVFCSVEWFDYVEWCALRWKICTTFNDFYYVERFVECLMILTTLNYSECDGWFGLRWIIEKRIGILTLKRLGGSIWPQVPQVFIRENTVRYFTLTSALIFFPDLEISRRNIFSTTPEIGHKERFLITLVKTLNNVFSRHLNLLE